MAWSGADLYDRYIGRYGPGLAAALLDAIGAQPGQTALDVGCGPGALTGALVERLGAEHVMAVDPSPSFAAACRDRNPGADVREGRAEELPFDDGSADLVVSQLVVNFVGDPDRGLSEMCRVVRPGGMVGATVWDYADRMTLLREFWDAAAEIDDSGRAAEADEGRVMRNAREDELRALWQRAGLHGVVVDAIEVQARWQSFDELWSGIDGGIGPSGAWATSLEDAGREALRREFHRRLGSPDGPFEVESGAWRVVGRRA